MLPCIFVKWNLLIFSSPLPAPPLDERGPEQYTNTVNYQHLSEADDDDDIYSKPVVSIFILDWLNNRLNFVWWFSDNFYCFRNYWKTWIYVIILSRLSPRSLLEEVFLVHGLVALLLMKVVRELGTPSYFIHHIFSTLLTYLWVIIFMISVARRKDLEVIINVIKLKALNIRNDIP